ncbi:alpha-aminoadipic semialdehyde synthase, mitochondrial-like [Sycon ciliatum]|uniref:alpha-aminoadipic semialdehyde synthase, mitochondrial-like n=1 Tax=Sycon ciliatum TaxID=27933 RepID=UPI0020ADA36B|eukprot:scpid54279/ scgid21845/ Alpha-aminoadipic semialdehyde synthase, mitochondrial; LKR/SDH; Lysine ketoglutarate reductase; Saccharopine dehydrogenase
MACFTRSMAFCRSGSQPWRISYRHLSSSPTNKPCIGIRREESSVWERRAPLAPHHVRTLTRDGFQVVIQPSTRRAYSMFEYIDAGAELSEDLSVADVILGVKAMPVECLEMLSNKTVAFFSHTIKAQESSMPLLDGCIEKNVRILDYEKILAESGQRIVAFGHFAGTAGMINILHGVGLRLLALGFHTPLMHIGGAHNYSSTSAAKAAIANVGREIQYGLMPKSMHPLTFVFSGNGNVSRGAQEVFKQLPVQWIQPKDLEAVAKSGDNRRFYGCIVDRFDHLYRTEGGGYNDEEFLEFPERYSSNFVEKVAPHMSVLMNGIYWTPAHARLLTKQNIYPLLQKRGPVHHGLGGMPSRLLAIGDISCDLGGSIEFITRSTTLDNMFEIYDAESDNYTTDFSSDGILYMSIDNLPAQLPREATDFFGDQLLAFVPELARADWSKSLDDVQISSSLKDAMITYDKSLTPGYKYIDDLRAAQD